MLISGLQPADVKDSTAREGEVVAGWVGSSHFGLSPAPLLSQAGRPRTHLHRTSTTLHLPASVRTLHACC